MTLRMYTERDLEKIRKHGLSDAEAYRQAELFTRPPVYADLLRPCTPGDGIRQLDEETFDRLVSRGARSMASGRFLKFVPASGRASRMFAALHALRGRRSPPSAEELAEAETCFKSLSKFAFHDELKRAMKRAGLNADKLAAENRYAEIAEHLLGPQGLNYADIPKALISFHQTGEGSRTAFEEHLIEASQVVRAKDGACRLHFTVPHGYLDRFEDLLEETAPKHEKRLGARFEVSFSAQKRSTDTIVVGPDNEPFRPKDDELLFWAGGHGALLENLNALRADILFIKNIDNVVTDRLKESAGRHKLALAGLLLETQEKLFDLLSRIYSKAADQTVIDEAMRYAEKHLLIPRPADWDSLPREAHRTFLIERLDRPIRVCGMVPNAGEPGGGPFWTRGKEGVSMQIVERAQVAPAEEQRALFASATHFNPVDIVCGLKDYLDESFDLERFRDPDAVLVSEKMWEGRPIRILEHPGLWNGGMARWLTLFVEMPAWTFQPVKTLADLLKEGHQG
ncbi:MAG TPA: DUF4301 domain-containing protein [Elusimicrobia bacterium]|nr:DUF4301 domain-containing protein [Elusimicrobiota bacterium]